MKFTQVSVMLVLTAMSSTVAQAAGPDNVAGIIGRLERITCRTGYSMLAADAEKILGPQMESECGQLTAPGAEDACRAKMIKKFATAVPGAIFQGKAVEGKKTFDMAVTVGGKALYKTVRVATHGDGPNGTMNLMFLREGVGAGDDLAIDTAMLSDSGNSVPMTFVPVRRRGSADRIFIFVGGCPLAWADKQD